MYNKNEVIVVTGLPRSGTSMMMKILYEGGVPILTDDTRQADDDNPNGYYEFDRVKNLATDNTWLQNAVGKAVKIITRHLFDLPDRYMYKVLFMLRDLDEILQSQKKMLERSNIEVKELKETAIRKEFTNHLKKTAKWISSRPNFGYLYVNYRDLIDNPEKIINSVTKFLEIECDENKMIDVINPDLYRNRK